jgi:HK97 family phage portal protein
MSLFDNINKSVGEIREQIEAEEKGYDELVQEVSSVLGQGYKSKMKSSDYLKSAVGWVYGCVGVISDEIAGIGLKLLKVAGGQATEVDDHPALDLIYRANNVTTKFDLIKLTFQYLELTGEAPWFLSVVDGQPESILLLRPDRLTIKPGTNGEVIGGYTYKIFGNGGSTEIPLEPHEVILLKYPDPDMPLRGRGPLQAAASTFDLDNFSEKWNTKFFKNSATPEAVLATDQKLTKETRERIEKKLADKYRGVDNSHKTLILEGGLKMDKLTISQKDMDFIEQQRFSRDKILAIFRVPRTALGITDDVNRANAEATDYVFAKRTIKPKMQGFIEQLNEFLLPLFPGTEQMVFDYDNPVPENVDQQIAQAAAGIQGGYMTINEARELNDLDPVEGGDVLRDPMGMAPIEQPTQNALKAKQKNKNIATRATRHYLKAKNRKADESKKKIKIITTVVTESIVPIIYDNLKKKYIGHFSRNMAMKSKIFSGTGDEVKNSKYEFQAKQLKLADEYETRVMDKLDKVFAEQKNIILKGVEGDMKLKLDINTETLRYTEKLKPVMMELFKEQAKLSFQLLGQAKNFAGEKAAQTTFTGRLSKYFEDRMFKLAPEVVRETNGKLQDAFAEAALKKESIPQIKSRITELFDSMASYRSERIARSETIRGSNFATEEAYKESGVVEAKEWLATKDERTDDECMQMNGKIIPLGQNFFNKGDSFGGLSLDYESVKFPPLHVNCRCTLIPVIGKPAPAPGEWRSAMTLDQAKEFTKESKVKQTLFHGTTKAAGENISLNGFNVLSAESVGGNVVDGIYFTNQKDAATQYAMSAVGSSNVPHAKPEVLPVKINVRKIKATDFHSLFEEMEGKFGSGYTSAQVTAELKRQGYDAILMKDEVARQDYFGVFDPKSIVVVKPNK